MWFSFAITSALCPIVRPVVYSLSAGGTGRKSLGLSPPNAASRCCSVLARLASMSAPASFFVTEMGTSDALSAPPAIPHSMVPVWIACATDTADW